MTLYCGIRSDNRKVERYELTDEEVIGCARLAHQLGYGSVAIQGGERSDKVFTDRITRLVRQIKEIDGGSLGITLSLGEQSEEVYRPSDLPSDLLERRPDVRQAEEQLIAANANIGAARAAYFPSISLTGTAGFASDALSSLFTGGAGVWNIAGNALAPIFEGGKIKAQNKKAEAQYREQLASYTKTVQTAFKEAYDALAANRINRDVFDSYNSQTAAMRRSYELTKKQENAGLIGVTDLLSVEENLLSAEMNLSSSRASELSAVVNLCKALGGGWKVK